MEKKSIISNSDGIEVQKQSNIDKIKRAEVSRYPILPRPLKAWFVIVSTAGLFLAILFIFNIAYKGNVLLPAQYYYLLIAFYSSNIFLIIPARKKDEKLPWYDLTATFLTFSIAFYL